MRYYAERNEAVLNKMPPPDNRSIREMTGGKGISEATLYNRCKAARAEGRLWPDGGQAAAGWKAADKFAAVVETAALNGAELTVWCREKGLNPGQIRRWGQACEHANDWDRSHNERLRQPRKTDQQRLKALEREPRQKEKSLAETAALLVLPKKAVAIWGRGRMIGLADRRRALALIKEAVAAGARQRKACEILEISSRTYQRWPQDQTVVRDRRPEAQRPTPAKKLSAEEREAILAVSNSPVFYSLPPSQIVPALAEALSGPGVQLLPGLREADQEHHRGRSGEPQRKAPSTHCAAGPNQGRCWDITWVLRPARRLFY